VRKEKDGLKVGGREGVVIQNQMGGGDRDRGRGGVEKEEGVKWGEEGKQEGKWVGKKLLTKGRKGVMETPQGTSNVWPAGELKAATKGRKRTAKRKEGAGCKGEGNGGNSEKRTKKGWEGGGPRKKRGDWGENEGDTDGVKW